ncbi:hypothetical protein JCM8795_08570 [Hydrogenobaculum acidophilum]
MLEGLIIGFTMGIIYFGTLRIRTKFIFGKKYLYYVGWIISLIIFSSIFLYLNRLIVFDTMYFLVGIFIAQISVVSFYFIKSQKQ